MNKTNTLLTVLVLLTTVLIFSCKKDEIDPTNGKSSGKLEIVKGSNQSGHFGEFLSDTVIIKASSNSIHNRYLIKWEMIQGNGNIDRGEHDYTGTYGNNFFVDSTGILEIRWRLGSDFNIQKFKLILYVDSTTNKYGQLNYHTIPSDSLIISANGTIPTGWVRSCGYAGKKNGPSKIISFDNTTLYLVGPGLYSSTDGGLNWHKVDGVPDWENIVDAQFNSSGWLYVLTQNKGICYSKDLQNWEFINNGILDSRIPTAFLVEDSTMFVSFYFDGPYKTSNNGGFWRKMLSDKNAERFYHITRHPNGDIYLFDDWDYLWISKNYGSSWEKVDIELKYADSPTDLEIGKDGFIYIGANHASISKLSPDTYTGEKHRYYDETAHSTQYIDGIKIINNTVYYIVNNGKASGLYSSQNWQRLDLGFNDPILDYYLKNDGTFLLSSIDGWYYYNK